jgi:hypothetical protein
MPSDSGDLDLPTRRDLSKMPAMEVEHVTAGGDEKLRPVPRDLSEKPPGPLVARGDRLGFLDEVGGFHHAAGRFYAEAAEAWNRERFGEA